MRKPGVYASLVFVAAMLFAGCRREDVRVFEESWPALTDARLPALRTALRRYEGVRGDTVKLLPGGVLRMEYDSMKIARENIRREIEACLK